MGKAQNDPRKYLPTNLKIPWRHVRLVVAAMVNEKGEIKEEPKEIDGEAEEFQDEVEEPDTIEEEHTWKTKEFVLHHVDIRKRLVPARLHDFVRLHPKQLHDPTYEFRSAVRDYPLLQDVLDDIESEPEFAKGRLLHGYKWEEFRVIPGTNKEILDLSKDDEDRDASWDKDFDPDAEIYPGDTVQLDVEDQTYIPSLLVEPFPPSVLAELRNKHSRVAPRIDAAMLSKRETKAAQIEAQKIIREEKMKTPLQEIKERRLDIEKQVLEKRKLSDDELFMKLGSAMQKTLVSSGQRNRTQLYLAKMEHEKTSRAAIQAEKRRTEEDAIWKKKIEAEDKSQVEKFGVAGNLQYGEKILDIWSTDPKIREEQRVARRAEKEAALIADAKIRQYELTKQILRQEEGTLAAKVQALQEDIVKAEAKRDLQKQGKGNHARPAVLKRIPKLQAKLVAKMGRGEKTRQEIEEKNKVLDRQVEALERLKKDIATQALVARREREAEQKDETRWV